MALSGHFHRRSVCSPLTQNGIGAGERPCRDAQSTRSCAVHRAREARGSRIGKFFGDFGLPVPDAGKGGEFLPASPTRIESI
jgi:hypothetical protein